jgi:hypothetical protein
MNPFLWLKLWIAGYSRFSSCRLGMHRWDEPGGHCEKCRKCDEFFGTHRDCQAAQRHAP